QSYSIYVLGTCMSLYDASLSYETCLQKYSYYRLVGVYFLPFQMVIVEWIVPPSQPAMGASPFQSGLRRSWGYITDLFVGGLFMFFINDLTKTVVGEARPHFWDTCKPNITSEQCKLQYGCTLSNVYGIHGLSWGLHHCK
ncbi:hypothetical protein OTU49_013498, partial [Cherax quadricarinatus]